MASATVLTALRDTEYLGSHPRAKGRVPGVDIVFTDSGLSMTRGRREFGTLSWGSLTDLSAATWEWVERRITAPRVVFLGVWSIFFRKRTQSAHLIVRDHEGEWVFAVQGLTADELRAGLEPLREHLPHD